MEISPPDQEEVPFSRLHKIVGTLRGKDGCPWDRKQTPDSLKKYLHEECQELIEAIDHKDEKAICEEIGDVLFILSFLISIFEDRGQFTASTVFSEIIAKMIRRHPHVFAGLKVTDEQSLRDQWNRIKEQEKEKGPSTLQG
ncbi:MAG: MazG nucleotide pyrophosphohydrolase domain-containing protein [Desulfobulbus sp.]|nr:MazG nucleotide pyrophosphohydrolase domain-containing protein [Desulfobulbus sp.]